LQEAFIFGAFFDGIMRISCAKNINYRYATKIAKAVAKLYASPGNGKIELVFVTIKT
jgi:hypothetical protein